MEMFECRGRLSVELVLNFDWLHCAVLKLLSRELFVQSRKEVSVYGLQSRKEVAVFFFFFLIF